jgi:hypothetical protein
MDVNRISGYIPGKIVFFLMQVCLNFEAESLSLFTVINMLAMPLESMQICAAVTENLPCSSSDSINS